MDSNVPRPGGSADDRRVIPEANRLRRRQHQQQRQQQQEHRDVYCSISIGRELPEKEQQTRHPVGDDAPDQQLVTGDQ